MLELVYIQMQKKKNLDADLILFTKANPKLITDPNIELKTIKVIWQCGDVELASPHNYGACRPLMGDSDPQGNRRNPRVNQ